MNCSIERKVEAHTCETRLDGFSIKCEVGFI